MNTLKNLSEEQIKLLPTEQEIKQYEELGWYISKKIIPDEIIDNAKKGATAFYKGELDYKLKHKKGIADDIFDDNLVIQNNEFVTLQKKEIQKLGFYPIISAIASVLTRTNKISLFADSLINKLPQKITNKGIVGWHTDKAYWPTCSSNNIITAWVPFQDCTEDMGPLTHINNSNLWKEDLKLKSFFSFNNQNLQNFENYLETNRKGYTKTMMTLKKGQVSFHNCNTIHSSFPNTSKINRMALALHLQDESNTYQKSYKKNGEKIVIGYDKICAKDKNGNPDYRDPEIFPVLFNRKL